MAPTPSGYLHLGNALSFALTAALAKNSCAGLLLRIDDMDRERVTDAYVRDVFDTLEFLGIGWTDGPRDALEFEHHYSQRLRLNLYNAALQTLRESGKVYACSCSRAQIGEGIYPGTCRHKGIPMDAADVTWRLNTENAGEITMRMLNTESRAFSLPPVMQDFVVRKKDGFPAYQLCSLIDDAHFGVDLVVRGEDLWASTLAQLHLAEVLKKESFLETTFYHHPLLVDGSQRKLSKSAGDTSIRHLRRQGLSAEEVYTMLGRKMGIEAELKKWEEFACVF